MLGVLVTDRLIDDDRERVTVMLCERETVAENVPEMATEADLVIVGDGL